jgi:hypothetical protein
MASSFNDFDDGDKLCANCGTRLVVHIHRVDHHRVDGKFYFPMEIDPGFWSYKTKHGGYGLSFIDSGKLRSCSCDARNNPGLY